MVLHVAGVVDDGGRLLLCWVIHRPGNHRLSRIRRHVDVGGCQLWRGVCACVAREDDPTICLLEAVCFEEVDEKNDTSNTNGQSDERTDHYTGDVSPG